MRNKFRLVLNQRLRVWHALARESENAREENFPPTEIIVKQIKRLKNPSFYPSSVKIAAFDCLNYLFVGCSPEDCLVLIRNEERKRKNDSK